MLLLDTFSRSTKYMSKYPLIGSVALNIPTNQPGFDASIQTISSKVLSPFFDHSTPLLNPSLHLRTTHLSISNPIITYTPTMSSRETVLITGCSDGGIGSELAIVFQECGFHVFATARNPSKMSKPRDLPNVTLLTLDVVKPTDIKAAVEAVSKETGGSLKLLH